MGESSRMWKSCEGPWAPSWKRTTNNGYLKRTGATAPEACADAGSQRKTRPLHSLIWCPRDRGRYKAWKKFPEMPFVRRKNPEATGGGQGEIHATQGWKDGDPPPY